MKSLLENPLRLSLKNRLKLRFLKEFIYDCQVRQTSIKLHANSELVIYRGETYENKEPETLDWIDQFSESDIFYDIGANIGVYTLYAAKRAKCQIYSFEPESQNFASLVRNIYLNQLSKIHPHCLAMSENRMLGYLHVTGMATGDSQHHFGENNPLFQRECSFLQGCMSVSLNQLCFEYGLPLPTHIKIDVDGLEEAIIEGASEVLASPNLKSVLIEITQQDGCENPIFARLKYFGFSVAGTSKREYRVGSQSSRNYIFKRKGC